MEQTVNAPKPAQSGNVATGMIVRPWRPLNSYLSDPGMRAALDRVKELHPHPSLYASKR